MTVNFRSGPAVTSGNQTTGFTLSTHSGTRGGDLLVLVITNRDATANPTVVDNEGAGTWTRKTTQNATTNGSVSLWYKRASGTKGEISNTASKTVTVSGCTGSASGVLVTFSADDTNAWPR